MARHDLVRRGRLVLAERRDCTGGARVRPAVRSVEIEVRAPGPFMGGRLSPLPSGKHAAGRGGLPQPGGNLTGHRQLATARTKPLGLQKLTAVLLALRHPVAV